MFHCCVSLFVLAVFLCTAQPQARLAAQTPAYFDFRPENTDYLRYYDLINTFDSSSVIYTFGEVAISANGSKIRIFLATKLAPYQSIRASDIPGEEIDLHTVARTKDFILRGGETLTWFGCTHSYYEGQTGNSTLNTSERAWVRPGRTEFVTELVRSSDSTRIAVLDSVDVPPAISPADVYYGTTQHVNKSYVIPPGFDGIQVFIRISPGYDGQSPADMVLWQRSNWVNYSALYDSTEALLITAVYDSLRNKVYYQNFFHYCDSAKATTGVLPRFFNIGFNDSISALFYARYMEQHTDSVTGRTYWLEKRVPQPKNGNLLMENMLLHTDQTSLRPQMPQYPEFLFALPNSGTSGQITTRICTYADCLVAIRLISTDGEPLGTLWRGMLARGINDNIINTGLKPGTYVLSLEEDNGNRFHQIKVVVQ